MERDEETLTDYCCVKCHGKVAIVRKVNLHKGILPDLLIREGGKYRFVTCSLCGYTEMYDMAIYARKHSLQPCEDESAGLAPGT